MSAGPDVVFRVVGASTDEARWALAQYFDELDRRFANGFDTAAAMLETPAAFDPPSGLFLIAEIDDQVVGCGGIRWIDESTAEIKRMWVDPDRRGIGLGRRLLSRLEEEAWSSGRVRVVLDTNASLAEAIAMYATAGYEPIDRYNDNPDADHWFEKRLRPEDEWP